MIYSYLIHSYKYFLTFKTISQAFFSYKYFNKIYFILAQVSISSYYFQKASLEHYSFLREAPMCSFNYRLDKNNVFNFLISVMNETVSHGIKKKKFRMLSSNLKLPCPLLKVNVERNID